MSGHGEIITGPQRTPVLHKAVPMGVRVKVPPAYLKGRQNVWGTVVGVSFAHLVFGYIVFLDESFQAEHGEIRALTVIGSELEAEDGSNWRNDV